MSFAGETVSNPCCISTNGCGLAFYTSDVWQFPGSSPLLKSHHLVQVRHRWSMVTFVF